MSQFKKKKSFYNIRQTEPIKMHAASTALLSHKDASMTTYHKFCLTPGWKDKGFNMTLIKR